MATKLDQEFVESVRREQRFASEGFETLVREVNRLECYCEALEKRLSPEQIFEASKEGARKFVGEL